MSALCLFLLIFGNPIPIKVNPGDPILDLPLTALENGAETNLRDISSDGFAFFLSPSCAYCQDAIANIKTIEDDYDTVFIYVGEPDAVRRFIRDQKGNIGNSFLVDMDLLVPHGIVTFPAVLTYKDGKCKVAMHGPMTIGNLNRLVSLYNGTYTKRKLTKNLLRP